MRAGEREEQCTSPARLQPFTHRHAADDLNYPQIYPLARIEVFGRCLCYLVDVWVWVCVLTAHSQQTLLACVGVCVCEYVVRNIVRGETLSPTEALSVQPCAQTIANAYWHARPPNRQRVESTF